MCRGVAAQNGLNIRGDVATLLVVDRVTAHWIERALYDLETGRSLFESRRYLYVAFMCQQCIEKFLKAYLTASGQTPPLVHNLVRLAERGALQADLSETQRLLFADLNPYYIKARYGEYKDALSKVCTVEKAARFLKETEAFAQWCELRIKSLPSSVP